MESKLRKATQARVPSDPSVWQQMHENLEMIIVEDQDFSEQHDIEFALWQLHYKRIEDLQDPQNDVSLSRGGKKSIDVKKGLYGEGASNPRAFATAASYYKQATTIWPLGGNPHHQVLMDFTQLTMTLPNRREESIMKHTTRVANTSNMPVASNGSNSDVKEQSACPSLSCNAVLCSSHEASKDEVTQEGKSFPTDECGYTSYPVTNGIGPPNGESNFKEAVEFDPIKHHNFFLSLGVSNNDGSSSSSGGLALCGWQLTLDALDGFQALKPNQTVESESAASLYKVCPFELINSNNA
ncbi:zinc finger, C3HC [Tanacetum coccineum]